MSCPKPIIAQLIKSDRCSAEGLEVRANGPALAMCRKLLEAGYDPDRPLHCFRGETLAMKISSIAYGARYSVSEPSTGSGVRLVPYSDGPQKSGAARLFVFLTQPSNRPFARPQRKNSPCPEIGSGGLSRMPPVASRALARPHGKI